MALANVSNQLLRSAGEGTEVVANSPITGNGTSEQPLGIDENWHGQDGESVTFTVSAIPSGTRVTLSGAQGTESFDVMNGVDGTNGTDGAQGPAGPQGPQGDPGVPGETGPQGIQGERGPVGPQGEQGEQGPAGQDGAPGKSAYEIAVEDGFSGNVYEWLESLKGDQGDPGFSPIVSAEAIPSGTRITITDAVSSTVFDVMNGEQGPSGAQGPQGPEGPSGAQGPAGQDGRDGADGASGFSPIVSTATIASGTQVTITDLTGSHSFNVMNGEQGPSGATGPQGPSGESYTGSLMPLIGDNGIAVTSNAGNAVVEISSVAHDATISGLGTQASPLGVIGGGGSSDFSAAVTGDTRGALIARNGTLTNTIYTRSDDGSYHLTGVLDRANLNNADMGYTMPQPYSNITGALTSVKITGTTISTGSIAIVSTATYSAIDIQQVSQTDNSHHVLASGNNGTSTGHDCGYLMPSAWSTLSGTVGGSNFSSSAFGIIPSPPGTALTSLSYYDTGIGNSHPLSGNNTNNLGWTMPSAYADVKNDIITETMPEVSSHYSYKLSYTSPATGFTSNSGLEIRKYVGNTGTTRKVLSGNSTLGELVPEDYTSRQYLSTNAAGNMVWDDISNISPIVLVATSGDIPASGSSDNKVYIVTGT